MTVPKHPKWFGAILGFVAGYVDTLGFISLFGLFTAHITGNFVLLGMEVVQPGSGTLLKLLAFPAFILAVVIARLLSRPYEAAKRSPLRMLLGVEIAFLSVFLAAGVAGGPITAEAPLVILAGFSGAMAMGIQTAQGRIATPSVITTTVMTVNVTQLVIDLVDFLLPVAQRREALRSRIANALLPVAAFAAGAPAGALAYVRLGFWALAAPIVLLFVAIALGGDTAPVTPADRAGRPTS